MTPEIIVHGIIAADMTKKYGTPGLEIDLADLFEQNGVGDQRERRRQQPPEPGNRGLVLDRHDVAVKQAEYQFAIGPELIKTKSFDLSIGNESDRLHVPVIRLCRGGRSRRGNKII